MGESGLPKLLVDGSVVIGTGLSHLALCVALYALWRQRRDLNAEQQRRHDESVRQHELEVLRNIANATGTGERVNERVLAAQLGMLPREDFPLTRSVVVPPEQYILETADHPMVLLESLREHFDKEYRASLEKHGALLDDSRWREGLAYFVLNTELERLGLIEQLQHYKMEILKGKTIWHESWKHGPYFRGYATTILQEELDVAIRSRLD